MLHRASKEEEWVLPLGHNSACGQQLQYTQLNPYQTSIEIMPAANVAPCPCPKPRKFPVGRMVSMLQKGKDAIRTGVGSAVYMVAVLGYLTSEVLELAGNAARDHKQSRIIPPHLSLAVLNDEELKLLLRGITISKGGVLPNIDPVLLPKKSTK